MNMIKLIDKIKAEKFPLHAHHGRKLDQHGRELYATLLATVVLNKGQISEIETRLLSMLLSSLGLQPNTAKYLNLVQQINLEKIQEFLNNVLDSEEMQMAFLMDALILSRIYKPLNDTQMELMAEFFDLFDIENDALNVLIYSVQVILGIKKDDDACKFYNQIKNNKIPLESAWYEFLEIALQSKFDEGVWFDLRTGLMWSKDCIKNSSKTWGDKRKMSWDKAKEVCSNLKLANFHDWKLPTRDELDSLCVNNSKGYNCPNNSLFFPAQDIYGKFWVDNIYNYYSRGIYCTYNIDFDKGEVGYEDRVNDLYVRAVRG